MKTPRFAALIVVISTGFPCLAAEALPRSSPESQGVSSAAVLEFIEEADKNIESMNSFMLLRHGRVVAEGWWAPYSADAPHSLYSLSKSFTSTAVGLAIAEGKVKVSDEVLEIFPGRRSERTGQKPASDADQRPPAHVDGTPGRAQRTPETPWTKTFLAQPVPFKPGTHFLYNTTATYLLSAIVQKATGMTVLDYLKPRLFEPLGIDHPTWETSPQGISTGGFGLSIRTEDIAKFGQLYLQKGSGMASKSCPPRGWPRRRRGRPQTAATPRVTGSKATATSSGGAVMAPTEETGRSASTAS